jgi:glycosyltransferase involved in cell wall biosynthesis
MPREIIVNGRFLSRRVTGVERHGREILRHFTGEYRVEKTRAKGVAGHAWEQFILPAKVWSPMASRRMQERAPALHSESMLWSPANSGPLLVQNQALTIHDLSPLEHPEWFNRRYSAWYRSFLPTLAKRVRVIFTPSEYVKQKVISRFGVKNVVVAPNGVDASVFHPEAKQTTFELPSKYILFVGSLQPRKNLDGLLRAWQQIKDEFRDAWLMVAGGTENVFRALKFPGDDRVRFLNYVDESDLPGLYANAALFVLPSLDEGFGLPALEAMACGTPVIVSNGGALPEVVGDAGLIFDLAAPDTLTDAMRVCLRDENLRNSLIAKGLTRVVKYSWRTTADLIWKTLNDI